jgi:ubiquinone/menaquinone biosynthesis C-methylase UbiE
MSEMFPKSSIVVVNPPGLRFYDDRPNVTFVDGRRHDMPLKDGFADYLMLEGFPREASVRDTIRECARVIKDDGHFILRVPKVMTEEQIPRFTNFAEFTMKQYYDLLEQDRRVSLEGLRSLLSEYFERQKEAEIRGIVVFYATCKKSLTTAPHATSPRMEGKRTPISARD